VKKWPQVYFLADDCGVLMLAGRHTASKALSARYRQRRPVRRWGIVSKSPCWVNQSEPIKLPAGSIYDQGFLPYKTWLLVLLLCSYGFAARPRPTTEIFNLDRPWPRT